MPTKAVTGTKQMKTTKSDDQPDEAEGTYPRRNWTDDKGVRHTEERRPPSKVWVEVETD
jgi:hypothetical protein